MDLKTDLRRFRKQLIDRAIKRGIYENFGINEVRRLTDRHIDLSCHTPEMNHQRDLIDSFADWCRSFDDRRLNRVRCV